MRLLGFDDAPFQRAWRGDVPVVGILCPGPMEPCGEVWVQRAGIDLAGARALLTAGTVQGRLPEALRIAHLVAGALARGESRGRA